MCAAAEEGEQKRRGDGQKKVRTERSSFFLVLFLSLSFSVSLLLVFRSIRARANQKRVKDAPLRPVGAAGAKAGFARLDKASITAGSCNLLAEPGLNRLFGRPGTLLLCPRPFSS